MELVSVYIMELIVLYHFSEIVEGKSEIIKNISLMNFD